MIRRGLAVVATATLALLVVLLPATGAGAQLSGAPNVVVNEPEINGADVTISGTAEMGLPVEQITDVSITVTPRRGGDSRTCQGGCGFGGPRQRVAFSNLFGGLQYNGPYDVTVDVTGGLPGVTATRQRPTSFRLEVPPAPPAGLEAVANPDGTVGVSWARNNEPDLARYEVLRHDPGTPGFRTVEPAVAQPPDGPRVQWTDTTAAQVGGQLEYQVAAIRPDGDGAISDRATSRSATVAVSVPVPGAPPGTPGAGPAPGTGINAGSGAPNRSSFITGAAGGGPAAPFTEPDGTYSETLPFGARRERAAPRGAADDDAVVVLGHTTNRRAILLPIAAGLFLCVSAVHLRLFARRVIDAPLEA